MDRLSRLIAERKEERLGATVYHRCGDATRMCGRYALIATPETIDEAFGLDGTLPISSIYDITPRYNIAPGTPILAIRIETSGRMAGRRVPAMLQWGLMPSWSRDLTLGQRLIQARCETAADKPAFRAPFRRRRCLLPANAWFEWRKGGRGIASRPHAFARRDGRPIGLGAIWESWEGADGSVLETVATVTTPPNALAAAVHDRMPLIIHPRDYSRWLDPKIEDPAVVAPLLRPFPAAELRAWPVSTVVNEPANDTAQCLAPIGEDIAPAPAEFKQQDLF